MTIQSTGQEWFLRGWLQAEANRLAQLIHESVLTPDQAHFEMRVFAARHAARAKLTIDWERFAHRLLVDEWHRQDAIHAETLSKLSRLAVQMFNRRSRPEEASVAIGDAADQLPLSPPVALLHQALHLATLEHRRSVRWRMRMGATT
jgi:hypothetical protein